MFLQRHYSCVIKILIISFGAHRCLSWMISILETLKFSPGYWNSLSFSDFENIVFLWLMETYYWFWWMTVSLNVIETFWTLWIGFTFLFEFLAYFMVLLSLISLLVLSYHCLDQHPVKLEMGRVSIVESNDRIFVYSSDSLRFGLQ